MPEIDLKKYKTPLIGIFLLIMGSLFIFGKPDLFISKLSSSFSDEPVKIEGFEEENKKEIPTRIEIPDLSIDLEVKRAPMIDGYWKVFPDVAGWGVGSGLPGETGNQVIFAHARKGLFLPLRRIELGMKVKVLAEDKWYFYRVAEIEEVFPDQIEVISPTEEEILTLYTCSGFNDEKRLIVIAKPSEE